MRNRLPLLLSALVTGAWLLVNLALFTGDGLERARTDARIGALPDAAVKRQACWDRGAGAALQALEPALADARAAAPERVLMLHPPRSNVLTSAAYFDLFPTQVVPRQVRDPSAVDPEAAGREAGAGAVLYLDLRGGWKLTLVGAD